MKPYSLLDEDQQAAITRLVEHDHTLLVAGMGAGKTVIAATAIDELLNDGVLGRVLVVAPLKTLDNVWPVEVTDWEHLVDSGPWSRAAYAVDSAATRRRAVDSGAPIVLINFENLGWLCEQYDVGSLFDGLLVDEGTKLKATGGVQFKRLRRFLLKFDWRVVMSGTPVSENLIGLFGQMLIVDGGKTLGRNRQAYLDRYFMPMDYNHYKWAPRAGMEELIVRKIAGYVHVMPDYRATLPPLEIEHVPVSMPAGAWEEYRLLARESALDDVEAPNEAVLGEKLRQLAAGFLYVDGGEARDVHAAKWEAFDKVLEPGTVIVYLWTWQRDELVRRGIPLLDGDTLARWNAGELEHLAIHPRSAGHGLNLQAGGARVLWLSPHWSRDLFDQTNARVWRRGQASKVLVQILVSTRTMDEEVIEVLDGKAGYHERFVAHLAALQG